MNDKKITLKDFFESDEKLAIHCKNEEESKKLCEAFDKMKKTWHDGVSYVNLNLWVGRHSQNGICYLNNGFCAEKKWCLDNIIIVYEFENVKFEEEIKMNENVKKVFDMLGVKPNEVFKIKGCGETIYKIDEKLWVYYKPNSSWGYSQLELSSFLTGENEIVKLPKKKKLRDLTMEEYKKWKNENCLKIACEDCPFYTFLCDSSNDCCWFNHKDMFSDKFLDQEVEVE